MLTPVVTYRTGATPTYSGTIVRSGWTPAAPPTCDAARMTNEIDAPTEITDSDLEQWYRVHNGRDIDGRSAGIGIQARDRLIRKLIDEVRRLRSRSGSDGASET